MRRMVRLTLVLLALGTFPVPLSAEEPLGPEAELPSPALVEQLGNDSYELRERAREELARREYDAEEAIRVGLKSDDLEVRYHCERLLVDIREQVIQRQLDKFVDAAGTDEAFDFPAWKSLTDVLGDTRESRALYVEMYRAEPETLKAFVNDKESLGDHITARAQLLQRNNRGQFLQPALAVGNVAAMLFAGCSQDLELGQGPNSQIYQLCYQQVFRDAIQSSEKSALLKKLLARFVDHTNDYSAYQGLNLLQQHNMHQEALGTAERLLDAEGRIAQPHIKQMSILILAKSGNADYMPRIEKLLDDKSICSQTNINKVMYKTEIRDVALFALLHLSKQEPKEYGFDRVAPNPQLLVNVHTLGFKGDEDRNAAFAKWKAFQEEQAKKASKPEADEKG